MEPVYFINDQFNLSRESEVHGICIYSTVFFYSLLFFLTTFIPEPTVSVPQCTACAFICAEVAWSYIIHGSCDLRRVSYGRSNKMEYW